MKQKTRKEGGNGQRKVCKKEESGLCKRGQYFVWTKKPYQNGKEKRKNKNNGEFQKRKKNNEEYE